MQLPLAQFGSRSGKHPYSPGIVREVPQTASGPCTIPATPDQRDNHRKENVAGHALVRYPVSVTAHSGELMRAVNTRHVNTDQTLIVRKRLQVLARELVKIRASEPRGAGEYR